MGVEDDDDDDGSAGVAALALALALALAPAVVVGAGAVGSEEGWASRGGDCGWEGETRGRSGGTEKGSERAAFG